MEQTTFTKRKNAKRAAERMIDNGTAPSIDYKLHAREDGRIDIQWQPGVTPAQANAIDVEAAEESLAKCAPLSLAQGFNCGSNLKRAFAQWYNSAGWANREADRR